MTLFRNLTFQRTISLIFLFAVLLSQTQLLYACEQMDGKPKMVCCCDDQMSAACLMTTPCSMDEQAEQNKCCEVSYDSLTDISMIQSSSSADSMTLLLDGPQPPPIFSNQSLTLKKLEYRYIQILVPDIPLRLSRSNTTYLFTRRLRL